MFSKPKRTVTRVFIHCTASDLPQHDNVAAIRKMHLDRGWSDIGYHLFISKKGKIEKGRDLELTPAAQRGHNTGTIAICLHGLRKEKFTNAQFERLQALCLAIDEAYLGKISFHGHCEIAAKTCPVFDYKKVLMLDNFGSLGLSQHAAPLDNELSKDPAKLPELKYGSRGETVVYLQELLLIKPDGIFGPKTKSAVIKFKKENALYPSDIVTKHVWNLLINLQEIEHID